MSTVRIVTDSHSSITQEVARELGITVLAMPFEIDGKDYFEGVDLSREEFFDKLASGAEVHTSQPVPLTVLRAWDELLETYDQIVYIPISSGLSGSCETAQAMAQKKGYKGRVFVVDNGRVSTPMYRSVLDAIELVKEGFDGAQIKELLEAYRDKMNIYIAVDSLEHLRKGGRVSAMAAAVGSVLNIKPVLQFDVGTLNVIKKCRGMKLARKSMIEALKQDFATKFKEFYDQGEIYLLAASSCDEATTESWVKEIKEAFPDMEVLCEQLPLAICCHIGQGGLGVGYSCRPRR